MDKANRYTDEDWKRLGRTVKRRRIELGYTQPQLSAAGGPSASVISKIEGARATYYEDRVIIPLEDALRWKRGSVERILDGHEPVEAQITSDTETPASGLRFPSEFPDFVGDYPGAKWIWEGHLRELLTEQEARLAIAGVQAVRGQAGSYRHEEPKQA